jgi:hypothetical protein
MIPAQLPAADAALGRCKCEAGHGGAGVETRPPLARPAAGRVLLGVSAGLLGTPVAVWLTRPVTEVVMTVAVIIPVLAVIFTALYGSSTLSNRAFRLLCWAGG